MGLVLNRPAETLVADVVPDLSDLADDGAPVYFGGPVASDSVIVLAEFDEPALAGVLLDGDLGFVGSESARTSATSPAACAARASTPATPAGARASSRASSRRSRGSSSRPSARRSSARTPSGLWSAVLRRKGREYALLSTMPPDPSVN